MAPTIFAHRKTIFCSALISFIRIKDFAFNKKQPDNEDPILTLDVPIDDSD